MQVVRETWVQAIVSVLRSPLVFITLGDGFLYLLKDWSAYTRGKFSMDQGEEGINPAWQVSSSSNHPYSHLRCLDGGQGPYPWCCYNWFPPVVAGSERADVGPTNWIRGVGSMSEVWGAFPRWREAFLKLAGVGVRVQSCAQGRRCLAKVQVVYWRCTEIETKGARSGIMSGGVETAGVYSSEVGQRVRTWWLDWGVL